MDTRQLIMGYVRHGEQVNCYIITIEIAADTVKETQLIERSKWNCIGIYEENKSCLFSLASSVISDVLNALLLFKRYTYKA